MNENSQLRLESLKIALDVKPNHFTFDEIIDLANKFYQYSISNSQE
jgi:hypothetical protein